MSIIGVEKTKNKIRFAYDSQTTIGDERAILDSEPKTFQVSNITVGIAGATIVKQYLKEFLKNDKDYKLNSSYDVHNLLNEFISANKENKHISDANDLGVLLISDSNKVYRFDLRNWSCHEINDFYFVGSSWQTAEGAYIAYKEASNQVSEYKPDCLYLACVTACKQDLYSSEPVKLIEIRKNTK